VLLASPVLLSAQTKAGEFVFHAFNGGIPWDSWDAVVSSSNIGRAPLLVP